MANAIMAQLEELPNICVTCDAEFSVTDKAACDAAKRVVAEVGRYPSWKLSMRTVVAACLSSKDMPSLSTDYTVFLYLDDNKEMAYWEEWTNKKTKKIIPEKTESAPLQAPYTDPQTKKKIRTVPEVFAAQLEPLLSLHPPRSVIFKAQFSYE